MAARLRERQVMKADIKAQWIADLRSGEFEQGKSYLETVEVDGKHKLCCLGVLSRQAVKAGVIPEPELHNGAYLYLDDEYDQNGNVTGESFNQSSSLPRKVQEWAGVTEGEGDIALNASQSQDRTTAIEANDMDELPFSRIADLVEQYVPVTE
jgi:hypothetical protein